ncbi:MAG: GNAT family N-acetyltransferase [Planctomycetota bacterium]
MEQLSVRQCQREDCADIWSWRNDELARRMSHETDPIPWVEHCEWYERALQDDARLLLLALLGEDRIGMGRFDFVEKDVATVSINMNPGFRGKGLGRAALDSFCEYAFRERGPGRILAEVKSDNRASRRCFEACGFQLQRESDGILHYVLTKPAAPRPCDDC